jgi:hypothetical protein
MIRPRHVLLTACWLLAAGEAWSEEIVGRIRWHELAAAGTSTPGTVVDGAQGPGLRVVHDGPAPATLTLVTIERPPIRTARYAIRGRVKYDGVALGSFLEMWNHLPEGAFFSRTLGSSGPMRKVEGTSDWRTFVLPFTNREGGSAPDRLVVNLVMAGKGAVEIGPLELVQFTAGEDPLSDSSAWWSDRQAGVFGSIVGSALGVLGAIIGILGSIGRARDFVLRALQGMAWVGLAAVALGLMALIYGQPYAVYYPLLLAGTISAALGFSLPRSLSKRYEDLELRRMHALDA